MRVGEGVLVHNEETREVHLLNETAAKAWETADGQLRRGKIIARLCSEGVERSSAEEAVRTLETEGLLRK